MLLEHLQNPLVSSQVSNVNLTEGIYWFFQALLICALSYEDNIRVLNDDAAYKDYARQFLSNLEKNMEQETGWNVFAKIRAFKEYSRYFMDMPLYINERDSDGVPSGVDWKQTLFLVFKKMGYTEKQILNMSFKKLFYEWCSYAEAEGAIKVMNKFEVQQLKGAS